MMLEEICRAVLDVTKVTTILKNKSERPRKLESLEGDNQVMCGKLPKDPVLVPMNGAKHMANLTFGQKMGRLMINDLIMSFSRAFPRMLGCLMCFAIMVGLALPLWRVGPHR